MNNKRNDDLVSDKPEMGPELDLKTDAKSGGVSRRNVAKAGMAAPLLVSFFARPAWATAGCPSALMSGNASGRSERDQCNGNGCTPGFWKNNLEAWARTPYSPGEPILNKSTGRAKGWSTQGATRFIDVFQFQPSISMPGIPTPISLLDVMLEHQKTGSLGTYENHLVAALLNAAASPALFGATTEQIIGLARAVQFGMEYEGQFISQPDFFSMLVTMNEAGSCPYNAKGNCADGFVLVDGACVPAKYDNTDEEEESGGGGGGKPKKR